MANESFYSAYGAWKDRLAEGAVLKLERTVEYERYRIDIPEIVEKVSMTIQELKQEREDSAKKEQDIFKRVQGVVSEWETQAAQTLLLDKALEYANTPQVVHTSNQWKQLGDGNWEISNLVYKMSYKIWKDTTGDKKGTWLVSWSLEINCPKRPPTEKHVYCGGHIVAEQKKKRYDTFDAAQRYIQGRFDLYAHHFSELRPPVPDNFKRHFYINGCLLPNYIVASPVRTEPDRAAVDALLEFAEAGDIPSSPPDTLISEVLPPAPDTPTPEVPFPAPASAPAPPARRKPARSAPKLKPKKSKAARGGTAR